MYKIVVKKEDEHSVKGALFTLLAGLDESSPDFRKNRETVKQLYQHVEIEK